MPRLQLPSPPSVLRRRRWLVLFLAGRAAATSIAIALVVWNGPDLADALFLAYAGVSLAVLASSPRARHAPAVWLVDGFGTLAFVLASGDWRSAYYLLWLSALALPAVMLPRRHAAWLAVAAPAAFFAVALVGGPAPGRLGPVSSETLAIHLSLPPLFIGALAYAADALRHLGRERTERQRLALEAERRRIAWDLHDSAKQRLHAAHLLVTSLQGRVPGELAPVVDYAAIELESAAADMDTSLAELKSPLDGRALDEALAARARELAAAGDVPIRVDGRAPALQPLVSAHAYRIGCEAMSNALRHARASAISVRLDQRDGTFRMVVRDDGRGLPRTIRDGGTGMSSMHNRAASIGADLTVTTGAEGRGTEVRLAIPLTDRGGSP